MFEQLVTDCINETVEIFNNPFNVLYITKYSEGEMLWYVTFSKPVRPSVPIHPFRKVLKHRFFLKGWEVHVEVIKNIKIRDSVLIKLLRTVNL